MEPAGRGDAMRGLARTGVIDLGGGDVHPLLEHSNRGKKSIALDLSTDEGREVLYRLAEVSDVFLTNKLPRVRKALHVDVDDIRARNPRIVYVRGSGYGPEGPDADAGGVLTSSGTGPGPGSAGPAGPRGRGVHRPAGRPTVTRSAR